LKLIETGTGLITAGEALALFIMNEIKSTAALIVFVIILMQYNAITNFVTD
jgi:hypothetical protein